MKSATDAVQYIFVIYSINFQLFSNIYENKVLLYRDIVIVWHFLQNVVNAYVEDEIVALISATYI